MFTVSQLIAPQKPKRKTSPNNTTKTDTTLWCGHLHAPCIFSMLLTLNYEMDLYCKNFGLGCEFAITRRLIALLINLLVLSNSRLKAKIFRYEAIS